MASRLGARHGLGGRDSYVLVTICQNTGTRRWNKPKPKAGTHDSTTHLAYTTYTKILLFVAPASSAAPEALGCPQFHPPDPRLHRPHHVTGRRCRGRLRIISTDMLDRVRQTNRTWRIVKYILANGGWQSPRYRLKHTDRVSDRG
jgi:hypothetical protein